MPRKSQRLRTLRRIERVRSAERHLARADLSAAQGESDRLALLRQRSAALLENSAYLQKGVSADFLGSGMAFHAAMLRLSQSATEMSESAAAFAHEASAKAAKAEHRFQHVQNLANAEVAKVSAIGTLVAVHPKQRLTAGDPA